MRKSLSTIIILVIAVGNALSLQTNKIDSLEAQLLVTTSNEKVVTLINLSEAYRNILYNDCIKYGTQTVELADKLNDKSLKALALKSLGISSYYSGDMDISLWYYSQSLELYEEVNDKKGQASCLNNLGNIYLEWANFDKAIEYYTKSFTTKEILDDKEGMAISLLQIGNISFHRANFQRALDKYYQALLIFTEIDDIGGIAYSYNSIGIIFKEWNKFEKALEYYEKARDLYSETNNKRALSQVLTNMGEVYNFELKDYKTALNLYNEALQIKNSLEDVVGIALLNNNLGTLYANMEDRQMALEFFNTSLRIYIESGISTGKVMVNYNIGEIYRDSDEINKAIDFFLKSLNMAKENGQVDYINRNYEALVHCYANLGDYDKFQKYFRLFSIGKDSLINKLYELELKEVEMKYKVEESIRERVQLQKANEKKEQELSKYKFLFTVIGGIIILSLFSYLLFLRIRKK